MAAKRILLALPFALACSQPSLAQQWRCDCTSIIASCNAEVVPRGSYLEIKSDEKMCSRVDYFVDGVPFVSVVVEGEDRQDWLARTDKPKILVQSCQVCRDNASAAAPRRPATAAPASAGDPSGEPKGLEPLIASTPAYPESARQRRVEGYVDVEFTVNALGNVEQPHVVASQPTGVFDAAALAAVSRWRYPAVQDRAPQTLQERVEFEPDDAAAAAPTSAAATAGPRNQCVREDAVYNFGEVIDVGLINACSDPLVVFGCAEGTGRYAGRWICNDSEQQGKMLVPQNDQRLGRSTAATTESVRALAYTDGFSVTRAPNSQYWWVACSEKDSQCRADARQWVRSVAGQPSTVDPQDRSRVGLARSN